MDRGINIPEGWADWFPVEINVNVHNRGLGYSWNLGYKKATRKYILHSEEDWAVLEPDNFNKIFSVAMFVCEDYYKTNQKAHFFNRTLIGHIRNKSIRDLR